MATQAQIHVIAKNDIGVHKTMSLSTTLSPLQDDHIRVRSTIISLTNNNLSYAQMGSILHWWDTYPVPSDLPSPYNDPQQYGIVPAWGYAEILESKVAGLEPGMLLFGFWPTTDLPTDLRLKAADLDGHWIEISEGRKNVFSMYQRYILRESNERTASQSADRRKEMAFEAAMVVWECGYLVNQAIFGKAHIHPGSAGVWSEEDADLSSAVVINLSAASKTGRSMSQPLVEGREDGQKPLGLLAIASSAKASLIPKATFPTKVVPYGEMESKETLDWVKSLGGKKIVILDCGGRGDSLSQLQDALQGHLEGVKIVVIGIGGTPTVRTLQDLGQQAQKNGAIANRVQMNTTVVRDALMEVQGAKAYFEHFGRAWDSFRNSSCVEDLSVQLGNGIDGFGRGWQDILDGKMASDVAMVYKI